jgi:adenine phosphoribosyltransferase
VLATGGTLRATSALVERGRARVVAVAVLVELASLSGREALAGTRLKALLTV